MFFKKWPPVAILDVQKLLCIAFLTISDQYHNLYFCGCPKITFGCISGHFRSIRNFYYFYFYKMATGAHFGCPKFTFDRISGHFRSIRKFFYKMAAVGHFGHPKFTLDHISSHFKSIHIFYLFLNFLQNGCQWPF